MEARHASHFVVRIGLIRWSVHLGIGVGVGVGVGVSVSVSVSVSGR